MTSTIVAKSLITCFKSSFSKDPMGHPQETSFETRSGQYNTLASAEIHQSSIDVLTNNPLDICN